MRRWTVLGVALCGLACSGGEDPDPPDADPNVPLAELCDEVAAADCARLEGCGALYAPLDLATCEAAARDALCAPVQVALQDAVAAGSLDYFELAARECVAAVSAQACGVGLRAELLAIPACRAMVTARGAEGVACHLGFDCAEGQYCQVADACPGVCRPLLGNNQPCTFGDACDEGLYCDVTAMRCLASASLGGACGLELSGNACAAGTFCDRSNPAAPVCRAGRGRNEGCQSYRECANGAACIRNLCSAGLEGDTCETAADCADGRVCGANRCRAPLAAGEACAGGLPCELGLYCGDEATCVPRPLAGDDCDGAAEAEVCFLSRCVAGDCVAGAADGEPCLTEADCAPGRACEGSRCRALPASCYP